jgi:hypothetical protein
MKQGCTAKDYVMPICFSDHRVSWFYLLLQKAIDQLQKELAASRVADSQQRSDALQVLHFNLLR